MSKIIDSLVEFWSVVLNGNVNGYPCVLKSQELSEEVLSVIGYPHIRFEVIDVQNDYAGILYTRTIKDDKINESFEFKSRYLLDFDLYFKSDEPCDIDDLKFKISNKLLMSRINQNYNWDGKGVKDLVVIDYFQERPMLDIFQDQTVNRNNYQQAFVVDVVTNNEVYKAKEGKLIYKGRI